MPPRDPQQLLNTHPTTPVQISDAFPTGIRNDPPSNPGAKEHSLFESAVGALPVAASTSGVYLVNAKAASRTAPDQKPGNYAAVAASSMAAMTIAAPPHVLAVAVAALVTAPESPFA